MINKKTILFDFDGVIHSYTSGWQGEDIILDPPVPGIQQLIEELREIYVVKVYSSRCCSKIGRDAVIFYLRKHKIHVDGVVREKVPAVMIIDDRAIQFKGDITQLKKDIANFKVWNKN